MFYFTSTEDGGRKLFRNGGVYVPTDKASCISALEFLSILFRDSQR